MKELGVARSSTEGTDKAKKQASRRKPKPQADAVVRRRPGKKQDQPEPKPSFLDERARRDVAGVSISVLAVALFVVVAMPSDALVASFASHAMRLSLGFGAYVLPFALLAVGVSFLVRFDRERVPARVAVGIGLVFIAVLTMLALFTPEAAPDATDRLFVGTELVSRGGYLGAGLAWVGLSLLGQVVSVIVAIGLALVGLVVIGLSFSKLIERVRQARLAVASSDNGEGSSRAPLAFTRVKRPSNGMDAACAPLDADESEDAANDPATGQPTRKMPTPARSLIGAAKNIPVVPAGEAAQASSEGKAPRAMTRKLGRDRKAPSPSAARSSRPKTPLAAPSPEEGFELPPMSLLATSKDPEKDLASEEELKETGECLQQTLEDFNIMASVVGWVAGPTVTLFKVDLPAGIRVSRVTALEQDIALALAAPGVRIFAPIPGTNYVGIEVPNRVRQTVYLGDVIKDAPAGPLQIAIGKDVEGHRIVSDLAKMPHLLIGGTTGSGKSVSINAMIMSILMRATPSEVRFIMIDPKRVEFTPYNGIPHLYVPVVTEAKEAASALSWGVAEMERRLKVFSKVGARNIGQYNAKAQAEKAAAAAAEKAGEEPPQTEVGDELPYIVIIIDELADLMMNVGKEVEFSISRIAQLARAAGIHLIVATQRPSTNVVTGLIKANITSRIAFNVASSIDSRVILDATGAENLIGLGDLLLSKPELAKPQRIQGCYVSEDEINAVVEMLKAQGEPEYHQEILSTNLITLGASQPDGSGGSCTDDDPLIWEAADIVVSSGLGSTSNIQRRLKVGYSRAGRIMDMLEEKGVVGPPNGSKPREVLVDAMELETLKAFEQHDAARPKE